MREIRSEHIGGLVSLRGVVTRASDIKPSAQVVCYSCEACGFEVYQTVSGRQFNPIVECPSRTCQLNKTRGKLFLQVRGSKFAAMQEIKVQEPPDQVPMGHCPRTISVIAKGETTRKCSPGDLVTITGCYLPAPH